MKKYWEYLKYVLNHKKNVGIEAWKMGLYFHAIVHDISKFLPCEFIPYARWFYGKYPNDTESQEVKALFDRAWLSHQNRNGHHWDHWVNANGEPVEMPDRYVMYMVADWKGMSRKFGDSVWDYFSLNRDKMIMHENTIKKVEALIKP